MFRPRIVVAPAERPELLLSALQRRRLEGSWVLPFRDAILPLIEEQAFAPFYHASMGAPNRSVAVVLGILLLKDVFDLTDQAALDHFIFDLRWHIALDVVGAGASCCQKTLHNFRALLRKQEKARLTFEDLTAKLISLVGLDTTRQRLDSTHCRSNFALLKRLGLFCRTIELFLRRLRRCCAGDYASLPEQLRQRYHTDKGCRARYHGAASEIGRRRLAVVARDLFRLLQLFDRRSEFADWSELAALKRVLAEQCEVTEQPQQPLADDDDLVLGGVPVRLRQPKEVSASSLQTPHDPDVTYGKKGQGYEVQICETFGNKNKDEAGPDKPTVGTEACSPLVAPTQEAAGNEPGVSSPTDTSSCSPPSSTTKEEAGPDKPSAETEAAPAVRQLPIISNREEGEPHDAGPDKPELITHVEVTPSCRNDIRRTMPILKALEKRKLRPEELEADSNYTSSEVIKEARELGTDVNGPVMGNKELPKEGEVTVGDFQVDFEEPGNSRCPAQQPLSRQEVSAKGRLSLAVLATACLTCALAEQCPAKAGKGKHKHEQVVQTSAEELTCEQRRRYESTPAFRERYAWRAGIEATNSEMKRAHGLGQLRVRGEERVKVAVYLKALACNVKRVAVYLGKLACWEVERTVTEGRAALAASTAGCSLSA
jgi:hypothetical protein